MKKQRDMYFENQGYFGNPGMPNQFVGPAMYSNNMVQMGPNVPYGNINYSQTFPNYPNSQYSSIEQRINRMERQIKRLDSRIARLENKCNIDVSSYQSTNDGYNVNETNMYML